jgi:hypothetical protein
MTSKKLPEKMKVLHQVIFSHQREYSKNNNKNSKSVKVFKLEPVLRLNLQLQRQHCT